MTSTAVVVGSGPNGLAAAVALAQHGLAVTVLEAADEIGGGTRSGEAIVPGLLHDHCSAIHPMAVGSTFLSRSWPGSLRPAPGAGPRSTACIRSTTAAPACCTARWSRPRPGSVADGSRWRRAFGYPAVDRFDALSEDIMGPLLRWSRITR